MDGCKDERMDGRTDGRMVGRTDRLACQNSELDTEHLLSNSEIVCTYLKERYTERNVA